MKSVTAAIADLVVNTSLNDSAHLVCDPVSRYIADTLGVTIAGHDTVVVRTLRSVHSPLPVGLCRILGTNRKTDMITAALINGTAAHALDYDDVPEVAYTHFSATVVPVILAVADQASVKVSDVVEAYVYAFQVENALAQALPIREAYELGWQSSGVLGPISAAVAAARIMQLNSSQVEHAVSLAAASMCGTTANFGSMAKPLTIGRAASEGLWCAQLAGAGMTAGTDVLGASGGLLDMFGARDKSSRLLECLEDCSWSILSSGPVTKPYPACSAARCSIDAVRALGVCHEQIKSLEVVVEPRGLDALNRVEVNAPEDAKFNIHILVALAAIDGNVTVKSFEPASLNRESLRKLAGTVTAVTSEIPPYGKGNWKHAYSVVKATLHDGSVVQSRIDMPVGAFWDWAEIQKKFESCTGGMPAWKNQYWKAARTITPDNWGAIFSLISPD